LVVVEVLLLLEVLDMYYDFRVTLKMCEITFVHVGTGPFTLEISFYSTKFENSSISISFPSPSISPSYSIFKEPTPPTPFNLDEFPNLGNFYNNIYYKRLTKAFIGHSLGSSGGVVVVGKISFYSTKFENSSISISFPSPSISPSYSIFKEPTPPTPFNLDEFPNLGNFYNNIYYVSLSPSIIDSIYVYSYSGTSYNDYNDSFNSNFFFNSNFSYVYKFPPFVSEFEFKYFIWIL
nr:hypothetical protein [Tanacetum cinerariifolium]